MARLIDFLFWSGTDFCINMANLMSITYDEFNMALFLFLMPGTLLVLVGLNVWKTARESFYFSERK